MTELPKFDLSRLLRWLVYSVLVGIAAGLSATLFLKSLNWATDFRLAHNQVIWLLPFAGFLIGWLYERFGQSVVRGTHLIIDEIQEAKNVIPLRIAPMIFFSTLVTHFFGGSAGREGTVVQIGASLADQLAKIFPIPTKERKILLISGAGAGFGAAIGAPLAGVIFGMEIICIGQLRPIAVVQCAVASGVAYLTSVFLNSPHTHFSTYLGPVFNLTYLGWVIAAALVFGALAAAFLFLTHRLEKWFKCKIRYSPARPLVGGVCLLILFQFFSAQIFAGLGIATIQESFSQSLNFSIPLIKILLTVITLASGFKGGEFIPLVFIGATAGSALCAFIPTQSIDFSTLMAAVGFTAVFGAAAQAPVTATLMAIELFGIRITPYALIACFIAQKITGKNSIYRPFKGSHLTS